MIRVQIDDVAVRYMHTPLEPWDGQHWTYDGVEFSRRDWAWARGPHGPCQHFRCTLFREADVIALQLLGHRVEVVDG